MGWYDQEGINHSQSWPFRLPLLGLKDEALGTGWDLVEPERSLVVGPALDRNCVAAVPSFTFPVGAVGMLLCKQMDSTTSTFGVGPEILVLISFSLVINHK